VSAGYYGLAVIGVLTSVVSVFFYLRVVVMMYMVDRDAALAPPARIAGIGMAALVASIAAIFYLGILPSRALAFAAQSISTIF
jgi:NADH-quinone oxidoreductase subunit N